MLGRSGKRTVFVFDLRYALCSSYCLSSCYSSRFVSLSCIDISTYILQAVLCTYRLLSALNVAVVLVLYCPVVLLTFMYIDIVSAMCSPCYDSLLHVVLPES